MSVASWTENRTAGAAGRSAAHPHKPATNRCRHQPQRPWLVGLAQLKVVRRWASARALGSSSKRQRHATPIGGRPRAAGHIVSSSPVPTDAAGGGRGGNSRWGKAKLVLEYNKRQRSRQAPAATPADQPSAVSAAAVRDTNRGSRSVPDESAEKTDGALGRSASIVLWYLAELYPRGCTVEQIASLAGVDHKALPKGVSPLSENTVKRYINRLIEMGYADRLTKNSGTVATVAGLKIGLNLYEKPLI